MMLRLEQAGDTISAAQQWCLRLVFRRQAFSFAEPVKNQAGDTIVEVLIALAILSLVLVSAYVITSQSARSIQDNQERVQAQHLVEGQIEALHAQGGINTVGDCFNGATETSTCNAFTVSGSGATYTIAITGPAGLNHASPSQYTVEATWTSLASKTDGDSSVSMIYRLN